MAFRRGVGPDFWQRTPLRALGFFLAAIFCIFGALGFLLDVQGQGRLSPVQLALTVGLSGGLAIVYLMAVRHRWRWRLLPILVLAQLAAIEAVDRVGPASERPLEGPALAARLRVDALGALVGLGVGYGCFVAFIQREGARRLRLQAEVDLAREIHDSLVPAVRARNRAFEVCGAAVPAMEVGGDLVDVVPGPDDGLTCCLLDVSGHGVPAGTLMAALKGALRMRVRHPADPGELLADLDAVLREIRRPNMFATGAALALTAAGQAAYSLAGHLPLLHWHASTGEVTRGAEGGPALGILEGASYLTTPFRVEPGDVLALVTDGLVEAADSRDRELGLPGLEAILRTSAREPLAQLGQRLLDAARAQGPQQDDQTWLLVRRLPEPPAV